MSEQRDLHPVYSVEEVTLAVGKSFPPTLIVSAQGTVRTGDWSSPTLTPLVYTHPPEDGLQEFTFDAVPPDGISPPIVLPIKATGTIELLEWMKGASVIAETNGKDALLPGN